MTDREKELVRDIYGMIVQYAYSSHLTTIIYRKYSEAFFKPRIEYERDLQSGTD